MRNSSSTTFDIVLMGPVWMRFDCQQRFTALEDASSFRQQPDSPVLALAKACAEKGLRVGLLSCFAHDQFGNNLKKRLHQYGITPLPLPQALDQTPLVFTSQETNYRQHRVAYAEPTAGAIPELQLEKWMIQTTRIVIAARVLTQPLYHHYAQQLQQITAKQHMRCVLIKDSHQPATSVIPFKPEDVLPSIANPTQQATHLCDHLKIDKPLSKTQPTCFWFNVDQSASNEHVQQALVQGIEASGIADCGLIFNQLTLASLLPPNHQCHLMLRIEKDSSGPLSFNTDLDLSALLSQIANRFLIKVTVQYHPDDPYALKQNQEAQLKYLAQAIQQYQHRLVLGIESTANQLMTNTTFPNILDRFYELGIAPYRWILPPQRSAKTWEQLNTLISQSDHNSGFMLNVTHAAPQQLPMLYQAVAPLATCRGILLGTKQFEPVVNLSQPPQEASTLQHQIAEHFKQLTQVWQDVAKGAQTELI